MELQRKKHQFAFVLFLVLSLPVLAQNNPRVKVLFNDDWRFHKGDVEQGEKNSFKDASWRRLSLPHDWSIEDLPELDNENRAVINVVRDTWRYAVGDNMEWRNPEYYDGAWKEINLPQSWEEYNHSKENVYGWFRKHLIIPRKYKGKDVFLNLGKIADVDQVYINGEIIGSTGVFPPNFRSAKKQTREYKVPKKLLKYGEPMLLSVRVYSKSKDGGIYDIGKKRVVIGPFDSHATEGRNSAYTLGGVGWYRKSFKLPEELLNKKIQILFEGIYQNATVWINEHELITHPYGYSSFWVDLSGNLKLKGDNVLAIKVDNSRSATNWYSGSGIYRHVWMIATEKLYVDNWGVKITTQLQKDGSALVEVQSDLKNEFLESEVISFRTEIVGADNDQVMFDLISENIPGDNITSIHQSFLIKKPELWSMSQAHMYKAVSTINVGGKLMDRVETPFGIRELRMDTINGFQINGEKVVLKGGNVHNDNGILGARSYDDAEERKVKLLKKNGYNAVRCIHNPPSSAFLDYCDQHGLLVVLDAFDTWSVPKIDDDYSVHFQTWWKKDLLNIIKRDQNHPSVIMWNIGNDVAESIMPEAGHKAQEIAGFVRLLDPTRFVTASVSVNKDSTELSDAFFSALDVSGYTYKYNRFDDAHKQAPERMLLSLETYPENVKETWSFVTKYPHVIGDFSGSALDYLGDAGKGRFSDDAAPNDLFPWTTAFSGDLDLLGDPRPQWYYRKTVVDKQPQAYIMVKPTKISLKERTSSEWGWNEVDRNWSWYNHDMVVFEVFVYTNCERIKLYQNGRVIAERTLKEDDKNSISFYVPYRRGSLRAIGFNGKTPLAQDILKTVDLPSQIRLLPDVMTLKADGQDLMFLTIEVCDENGFVHPMTRAPLHLSIKGPANIIALGNANPKNYESMTDFSHTTFQGKCVAVIQSTKKEGKVKLEVSAPGLSSKVLEFEVKQNF